MNCKFLATDHRQDMSPMGDIVIEAARQLPSGLIDLHFITITINTLHLPLRILQALLRRQLPPLPLASLY
jgi:hypothetical protein